jgi:hypothetical protein
MLANAEPGASRQRVAHSNGFHFRRIAQVLGHSSIETGLIVVVLIADSRQRNRICEHTLRAKAKWLMLQIQHTAQQQPGGNQQHDGKREFAGDQRVA